MITIPEFSVRTIWGMLTLPAVEIENKALMLEALRHPSFKAVLKHKEYICHALNEHSNIEAHEISDALIGKGNAVDGYVCAKHSTSNGQVPGSGNTNMKCSASASPGACTSPTNWRSDCENHA